MMCLDLDLDVWNAYPSLHSSGHHPALPKMSRMQGIRVTVVSSLSTSDDERNRCVGLGEGRTRGEGEKQQQR